MPITALASGGITFDCCCGGPCAGLGDNCNIQNLSIQFTGEPSDGSISPNPSGWIGTWNFGQNAGVGWTITDGLPCGCVSFSAGCPALGVISDGFSSITTLTMTFTAVYSNGGFATFTVICRASGDHFNDCVFMGNTANANDGVSISLVGTTDEPYPPCNFNDVSSGIIVMTAS